MKLCNEYRPVEIVDDAKESMGKSDKRQHRSHWKESEQRKYVNYLIDNRRYFELSIREKKARGIHSRLSRIIKTRSANQCRSHHQKMANKFGSFTGIIEGFRSLVSISNLEKFAQQQSIKIAEGAGILAEAAYKNFEELDDLVVPKL
jgi:hypothetical protein